jgi:hypothetical protein
MADIVISAQDQASKILDKVGDSTKVLAKDVSNAGKVIEGSTSGINVSFKNLLGPVAALTAGFAAFKGLGALGSFLGDSISGFDDATEATRKLTTAINLSGADAEASIDGHLALADAIERQLNVDADVVQGLMAQASALGVSDDKLDAVTKTAIGLSETMGIGLDEALQKARLATEGNFKAFEKLNPAITELSTGEEKLAAVLALAEKGLIQKTEAAGSAAQADERAGFALGLLKDNIGALLSPLQSLVYDGFAIVVESLQGAFGPAIEDAGSYFESFRENVVAGAQFLAESIIAAVTWIEVGWNNLPTVFEMVQNSVLLSLETLRADIEHILVTVIPSYAMWFADNFVNLIIDAGTAYVTAWTNIATSVGEIVKTLYDVIVGNIDISTAMNRIGESAGRSLLDGFEAQTQALPTIADRAMTDTEKLLNRSLETSATSLLDQFNAKFDERLGKIESDFESNPIVGKIDLEVDKDALNRQIKNDKVKRDDAILQVSESRLLTRGTGDDPAKQTQQNTANAVKELQELRKQMANQNKSNTTIKVLTA